MLARKIAAAAFGVLVGGGVACGPSPAAAPDSESLDSLVLNLDAGGEERGQMCVRETRMVRLQIESLGGALVHAMVWDLPDEHAHDTGGLVAQLSKGVNDDSTYRVETMPFDLIGRAESSCYALSASSVSGPSTVSLVPVEPV